ncbi:hypothetical protein GCM10022198_16640 [Klugiella xanthotipulae]|uniref:LPXTG-motif cell wall-anchored protein n=1 Tax=Klugiella xanthotipulae TaxID=244735 RepID=A0A543HHA7_9MICO|nr:S1 family peptidase [Klugiella xanthotipulae]TQM57700.1 LPXTG-motif cell wall-anchored protein [Klugiella xanthotipulae]
MQKTGSRLTRFAALGVVAALGSTGLFMGSAAYAAPDSTDAPTSGDAYTAQAKELLLNDGVQAVGKDKNGDFVIVALPTTDQDAASKAAITDFSNTYDNVKVQTIGGEMEAFSADEVVGGAGYYTSGFVCSIGFTAWDRAGNDAALTAGHCTGDGSRADIKLTVPSTEKAVTGTNNPVGLLDGLGDFGFSQFGGVGNTAGGENRDSIDVAVIDVDNTFLTLKPEVTDWTTGASDDLAASTIKITSVGTAQVGKPVSKSGRTTGYTSDASVDIVDGWTLIDDRYVYGFGTYGLVADHGDSGGAVFQGNTAVGILSGGHPAANGQPAFLWASDLKNSLAHTDGYTVKLALDTPVITSAAEGADVERRTPISGTAQAGTTVLVTPTVGAPFEVTTASNGTWTFNAPATLGAYGVSVQAKNGYNLSDSKLYSFNLVPQVMKVPVLTSPANNSKVATEVTEVKGTGFPGATVTIAGSVTGTAIVDASGNWTIPASLTLGDDFTVTVTQELDGDTGPVGSNTFDVVPESVVVTSPTAGQAFDAASAPTTVTGTGLVGAVVTATLDGVVMNDAPTVAALARAATAPWSAKVDVALAAGEHTISVVQVVDGKYTSVPTVITFVMNADGTVTVAGGGSGTLAQTGASVAPFGAAAALLLLVGAGLVVLRRRVSAQ